VPGSFFTPTPTMGVFFWVKWVKTDTYSWSNFKTAMNASWGTSTVPMAFIRFLPFACFCNSFFLRETSPP